MEIINNMEIFKDINKFENKYQISNTGKVRNKKTGLYLKPKYNQKGYQYVNLSINRYKSVINRINTEGVQNYKNAMNFYEPSFASSEFVYKYSSKIPSLDDDLPTASYDYNTGEYKENRKR